MNLLEAKRAAAASYLAAGPAVPNTAAQTRKDAEGRLRDAGLPGRRDEYWKYTDPARLVAPVPVDAPAATGKDAFFDGIDSLKLMFRDGAFDAAASGAAQVAGCTIAPLNDALETAPWARDLYGVLEARGQNPVSRALATLNTMMATQGVAIHATGSADKAVHLVYDYKSNTSDAILHHVVKVESGASLTILESGASGARANHVLEVDIADGGSFHHIRLQGPEHARSTVTHVFARLGAESTFKSFTMTANGVMTRNEVVIELNGDNGIAHVAGAALGAGDFHHDDTIFITHAGQHCESRQVFKKVLRNGATGVFQGKILVKNGAQKTDGYQISQSLLLDEDARFLAKPELEIYADDVACSHGSTTGAIDEEALFYLRSRGVPVDQARDLMVLAFLAEAVAEIEDEAIAESVQDQAKRWLVAGRAEK